MLEPRRGILRAHKNVDNSGISFDTLCRIVILVSAPRWISLRASGGVLFLKGTPNAS